MKSGVNSYLALFVPGTRLLRIGNYVIDRDNCTRLNPGFSAQCQVYSDRVRAVH